MSERYAVVKGSGISEDAVAACLPFNYRVAASGVGEDGRDAVVIRGEDDCGWTLDDYVLPRLASGLYFGAEASAREAGLLLYGLELGAEVNNEGGAK